MNEEALGRPVWRTRFGMGCWPVVKQAVWWLQWWWWM